ncbi:hypothetical protein ALO_16991 [Acetonema longum DSM 6540]|uniref:Uncharacterized protein n=1 Tax=Acetonema longum DSM 6540 TaxID=1009370 RepID=F7NMR7_9FIRM|nr:hypothetical protein ALO_16991 [Acetonema longum DSM 6540]
MFSESASRENKETGGNWLVIIDIVQIYAYNMHNGGDIRTRKLKRAQAFVGCYTF